MNIIHAAVLGIVQGLTEFLPVSSSGHLVLFQNLFGIEEPALLFDICLHFGTLVAVCVVFYRDILAIVKSLAGLPGLLKQNSGMKALYENNQEIRLAVLIVLGSVPTAVLGLAFHRIADRIFGTVWIVGLMLLITGSLLWATRNFRGDGRSLKQMGWTDAFVIGIVQGLAILPGISRSGSTISVALFLGLERELAGRFSFLLSLPAIVGALLVSLDRSALQTGVNPGAIAVGTLAAAMVGYGALVVLLRIIKNGKLYHFSPYCWILGAVALIWAWF